ncbi:hypothetical protein F2Q70_00037141 [Brassica cretica]|uniref:Uncharacterized protein n=1 Tax=Brassica cretica TaxID=69181 RepID=A0A8S9JZB0_BRACR|nr:hypothetical protein F2Q70_00037141 [Brassica cretica]
METISSVDHYVIVVAAGAPPSCLLSPSPHTSSSSIPSPPLSSYSAVIVSGGWVFLWEVSGFSHRLVFMTQIFGELKFFSAEPGTNQFVLQQRKAFRVFFSCLPPNSMNRFILYSIGGVCVSDGYND